MRPKPYYDCSGPSSVLIVDMITDSFIMYRRSGVRGTPDAGRSNSETYRPRRRPSEPCSRPHRRPELQRVCVPNPISLPKRLVIKDRRIHVVGNVVEGQPSARNGHWPWPHRMSACGSERWYIAAAVPDDIKMSAAPSRMIVKSGSP